MSISKQYKMKLDNIARKLGYSDAKNLQENIDAYGEPLQKWWDLLVELAGDAHLEGKIKSVEIIKGKFLSKEEIINDYKNK